MEVEFDSDVDSLFDEDPTIASLDAPSIPGLFFFPDLLPRELSSQVLEHVAKCSYFSGHAVTEENGVAARRNQAMLFGRASQSDSRSGLPSWADELIESLADLLTPPRLDKETYRLLFPTLLSETIDPETQSLSRQLILNLYSKGEGLTPHVDLLQRFADGIILCSFGVSGQGTVMQLEQVSHPTNMAPEKYDIYLPPRSVLILSKEARYEWKHGIPAKDSDLVRLDSGLQRLERGSRLSITIRRLMPGADVVGTAS